MVGVIGKELASSCCRLGHAFAVQKCTGKREVECASSLAAVSGSDEIAAFHREALLLHVVASNHLALSRSDSRCIEAVPLALITTGVPETIGLGWSTHAIFCKGVLASSILAGAQVGLGIIRNPLAVQGFRDSCRIAAGLIVDALAIILKQIGAFFVHPLAQF